MRSIRYKLVIFAVILHVILDSCIVHTRHVSEEINENSKNVFHSESTVTGGSESSRQKHIRIYDDPPSPCNVGVACPFKEQSQQLTSSVDRDQSNAHISGSTGLYPSLPSNVGQFESNGIKTSPSAIGGFSKPPSNDPTAPNYYATQPGFPGYIPGQPPSAPQQQNYPGFHPPPASYNSYPNGAYNSSDGYKPTGSGFYNPSSNGYNPNGYPSPYNGPPPQYNPAAPYPSPPPPGTYNGGPPYNSPGPYPVQSYGAYNRGTYNPSTGLYYPPSPQHQPPHYHAQYNQGGPCVQGCPQNHVDHTLKINSEYNESGHHVGPFQQPSPGGIYGNGGYNGAYNRGVF